MTEVRFKAELTKVDGKPPPEGSTTPRASLMLAGDLDPNVVATLYWMMDRAPVMVTIEKMDPEGQQLAFGAPDPAAAGSDTDDVPQAFKDAIP